MKRKVGLGGKGGGGGVEESKATKVGKQRERDAANTRENVEDKGSAKPPVVSHAKEL